MTRTQTSNALSWHYSISMCAVAGSFAMILPPTSSVAQTVQGTPAAYRAEESPPLDPRTPSCDALKDRLQRMGGALYVTGRQGWGETFYTVGLSLLFTFVFGLAAGVLLVTTESDGLLSKPFGSRALGFFVNRMLDVVVNVGRSIPFIILMILLIPFTRLLTQGMVLKNGQVMSKSKGNVVDPDDMIEKFGADALRLYVMFVAPPEKEIELSDAGLEGSWRFLALARAVRCANSMSGMGGRRIAAK